MLGPLGIVGAVDANEVPPEHAFEFRHPSFVQLERISCFCVEGGIGLRSGFENRDEEPAFCFLRLPQLLQSCREIDCQPRVSSAWRLEGLDTLSNDLGYFDGQ